MGVVLAASSTVLALLLFFALPASALLSPKGVNYEG
jgi:hypothetical protein